MFSYRSYGRRELFFYNSLSLVFHFPVTPGTISLRGFVGKKENFFIPTPDGYFYFSRCRENTVEFHWIRYSLFPVILGTS